MNLDERKKIIKAAASVLLDAVLDALQRDNHYWSERPCETCRFISSIVGRNFGCYLFAERKAKARLMKQKEEAEGV